MDIEQGTAAPFTPTRKSLILDGGALSYLHWQGNGPAVHFAHANGFNAQTYASLLSPLAADFEVFAADLRGHGQTTLPAAPGFTQGWTQLRDDLIAFLAAVPQRPLILVGHSIGAVLSLMTAAARPDLIRALVLIEPVLIPADAPEALRSINPLSARAAKRRSQFASVAAMEEAYRGRGAFTGWPDAILRDYILGGTRPTPEGAVELSCPPWIEAEIFASAPFGAAGLIAQIACPVTLLYGEAIGSTCGKGEVAIVLQSKPNCRVAAQSQANHFLPMLYPEWVRQEIRLMAGRL